MFIEEVMAFARGALNKKQYEKFNHQVVHELYHQKKINQPGDKWLSLPTANTINSQQQTTVCGTITR